MAYTAATLLALMEVEISTSLEPLGLDASDALSEAVTEVRLILGVDDVADVDDDLKLRTIARWQAWLAAEAAAVNQYDLASEGDRLSRQQWFRNIQSRLARAEASASRYSEVQTVLAGSAGVAVVTGSSLAGSPYGWDQAGGPW